MAVEIERKFLLKNNSWRDRVVRSHVLKQGYLASSPLPTVRVRTSDDKAFLTIKGQTEGISRVEFEYEIPSNEAIELLKLSAQPPIEKIRYIVEANGQTWEIDVFEGSNAGLVLAEVELDSEDEKIELPDWIDIEVTSDSRYYNSALSETPYSTWE